MFRKLKLAGTSWTVIGGSLIIVGTALKGGYGPVEDLTTWLALIGSFVGLVGGRDALEKIKLAVGR